MVSWRSIARGALTRFVPGVATVATVFEASLLLIAEIKGWRLRGNIGDLATIVLCLPAGYILTLALVRRQLHILANVEGRRSFVAGMAAMAAILIVLLLISMVTGKATPLVAAACAVVVGAATTFAIFYSHLRHRIAHLERTDNGELLVAVEEFAERASTHERITASPSQST